MNANHRSQPSEQDVQKEAYLLYIASGCVPGRDIENWLAARARLAHGGREFHLSEQSSMIEQLHFPPNAKAQRGVFETFSPFTNRN